MERRSHWYYLGSAVLKTFGLADIGMLGRGKLVVAVMNPRLTRSGVKMIGRE